MTAPHTETFARILRSHVPPRPPKGARGEITDKGSVNQRRVLQNRPADVARLYAEPRYPAIVVR
ncbi:MAG TPA: hypothetical protein VGD01_12800 [Candidatus Elarobacter sp.]